MSIANNESNSNGTKILTDATLGFIGNLAIVATQAIVVPHYLYFLGTRGYGVIALASTIQAATRAIDFGICACVLKDLPKTRNDTSSANRRTQIATYEAATILLITTAFIFAYLYLQLTDGVSDVLKLLEGSIRAPNQVIFSIATQSIATLLTFFYSTCLIAQDRHSTIAKLKTAESVTLTAMTVSLLRLSTATIEHIAILNAMVSVFYCAATRILLSKYSKGLNYPIKLNTFLIRQNATFAINAWWVNLVAIALLHFDRLVLVHYLDLEQYGTYCAVYSAVAAVYGLVLPAISNALAVRFATLQSQIASDLEAEHRFASQSLSLLSALGLITCAILTQPAMQLWQAPLPYARDIALLATILSLGHSANALMIPNHVLMLCQGNAAVPARLSTILALIFLPLLVLLSAFFGKYGAATNFACMNIAYAILGLYVAHRLRLTSQATSIVIRDTLPPSLLAISVGMITCLGLLKLTPMQAIFVYLLVITSSALTIKFLMPDFFSRLTLRHLTRKYSNTY